MAVSANQLIKRQEGCKFKGLAAVAVLYQGTLAFVNASGYIDDDTASGVNTFAGIVIENVDNSGGSAGDETVELWRRGIFELPGSGFTQADVGKAIYASDNYTLTLTATGNVYVGRVHEYVSATKLLVAIDVGGMASALNHIHVSANRLDVGDAADTVQNVLHIFDGGTQKPGIITLYDHAGVPHYIWVDNTGDLRIHTALPADEDADGTIVGTQS